MKTKKYFLILIACVLLFSCTKNEGASHNNIMDIINTEIELLEAHALPAAAIKNIGFSLAVNAGLYVLERNTTDTGDENTRVVWGESMALGESILTGNTRRLYWAGQPNPRHLDFVEVRRSNGSEGWSLPYQIAEGGRLAVVIDERSFLYSLPTLVDVSRFIIGRRSIVVYYPDTEQDGFVEIRGWNLERLEYVPQANRFVRLSSLSRNDSDIQSAILLQTALSIEAANQAERKSALLESALMYYPDSVFFQEIFEILYPPSVMIIEND